MTIRSSHRRLRALPLLVLLFVGLLLASPDLLHAHRASSPGLYSAECPLAENAARRGELSLPSAAFVVEVCWTVGPAPLAAAALVVAPYARHADSRAPPLV
jgi:hypothetical protein